MTDATPPLDALLGIVRPTDPDLPPDPEEIARARRERRERRTIGQMYDGFGRGPAGARCATCVHFQRHRLSKTYFKCARFGITSGAATDWRARWLACGLWRGRAAAEGSR